VLISQYMWLFSLDRLELASYYVLYLQSVQLLTTNSWCHSRANFRFFNAFLLHQCFDAVGWAAGRAPGL